MAQKKGTATARKKSAGAGAKNNKNAQKETAAAKERRRALWSQILPYILIVAAILLVICFFTGSSKDPGIVTKAIYNVLTGIFGGAAFVIPAFLVFAALVELFDRGEDIIGLRTVFAVVSAVLISVLLEIISPVSGFAVGEMFSRGTALSGGGVVGGLIGEAFLVCFKTAGSYVIVIAALILSVLLCAGLTPKYLFVYFSYKIKEAKERRQQREPEEKKRSAAFRDPGEIPQKYGIDETTGEVLEDDTADIADEAYPASEPDYELRGDIPAPAGRRRHRFDTVVPLYDEYPVA